ncbi:hypothetical protein [Chitinophaga sp. MM2321]|uniref:hypothetical protein n=1 Tax=Chitinophaga sp. MM2321 TaxID=3137178 RepID=UPI0032D57662
MRSFQFFVLFISFGYLLSSCKKDQQPDKIQLSSHQVELWAGQDTVISISGAPKQYTVSSENEEIARVVIQDNRILITTDLPGSTIIHITDGANNTSTIKLRALSVIGTWRRAEGDESLKARIFVETGDPVFADELQRQLFEATIKQPGTNYMIHFSTDPVMTFTERQQNTVLREGEFLFRNLTLTLTHNAIEDVYKIKPLDYGVIGLEQDLTAHYKALHPDKDIKKVVIVTHVRKATFPG